MSSLGKEEAKQNYKFMKQYRLLIRHALTDITATKNESRNTTGL